MREDCAYRYCEQDENYSIPMCMFRPGELWGVTERDCIFCDMYAPVGRVVTDAEKEYIEWLRGEMIGREN